MDKQQPEHNLPEEPGKGPMEPPPSVNPPPGKPSPMQPQPSENQPPGKPSPMQPQPSENPPPDGPGPMDPPPSENPPPDGPGPMDPPPSANPPPGEPSQMEPPPSGKPQSGGPGPMEPPPSENPQSGGPGPMEPPPSVYPPPGGPGPMEPLPSENSPPGAPSPMEPPPSVYPPPGEPSPMEPPPSENPPPGEPGPMEPPSPENPPPGAPGPMEPPPSENPPPGEPGPMKPPPSERPSSGSDKPSLVGPGTYSPVLSEYPTHSIYPMFPSYQPTPEGPGTTNPMSSKYPSYIPTPEGIQPTYSSYKPTRAPGSSEPIGETCQDDLDFADSKGATCNDYRNYKKYCNEAENFTNNFGLNAKDKCCVCKNSSVGGPKPESSCKSDNSFVDLKNRSCLHFDYYETSRCYESEDAQIYCCACGGGDIGVHSELFPSVTPSTTSSPSLSFHKGCLDIPNPDQNEDTETCDKFRERVDPWGNYVDSILKIYPGSWHNYAETCCNVGYENPEIHGGLSTTGYFFQERYPDLRFFGLTSETAYGDFGGLRRCIDFPQWRSDGSEFTSCDFFNTEHPNVTVEGSSRHVCEHFGLRMNKGLIPAREACCGCGGGYSLKGGYSGQGIDMEPPKQPSTRRSLQEFSYGDLKAGVLSGRALRVGFPQVNSRPKISFKGENGERKGAMIDFLELVARSTGVGIYEMNLDFEPNKSSSKCIDEVSRCMDGLRLGQIDFCAVPRWKGFNFGINSEPIFEDNFYLVVPQKLPGLMDSISATFEPFTTSAWLLIVSIGFLLSLTVSVISNGGLKGRSLFSRSISAVYHGLRSLFIGDVTNASEKPVLAEKLVILGFTLLSVVVITGYTATLAAAITFDQLTNDPLKRLDKVFLKEQKVCIQADVKGKFVSEYPNAESAVVPVCGLEKDILKFLINSTALPEHAVEDRKDRVGYSSRNIICDAVVISEGGYEAARFDFGEDICQKTQILKDKVLFSEEVLLTISKRLHQSEAGKDLLQIVNRFINAKYFEFYYSDWIKYDNQTKTTICEGEDGNGEFTRLTIENLLGPVIICSILTLAAVVLVLIARYGRRLNFKAAGKSATTTTTAADERLIERISAMPVDEIYHELAEARVDTNLINEALNRLPDRSMLEKCLFALRSTSCENDSILLHSLSLIELLQVASSCDSDRKEPQDRRSSFMSELSDNSLTSITKGNLSVIEEEDGDRSVDANNNRNRIVSPLVDGNHRYNRSDELASLLNHSDDPKHDVIQKIILEMPTARERAKKIVLGQTTSNVASKRHHHLSNSFFSNNNNHIDEYSDSIDSKII